MVDLEQPQPDPKRGGPAHPATADRDLAHRRSRSRPARPGRSAAARLVVGVLAAGGGWLGLASPALAGVAVTATPDPPSALAVGQTGVPSTLTVVNGSNGVQAGMSLTLEEITFVPSCGTQAITGSDCPSGAADPGVLGLSATVVGQSGTACAGLTFTPSLVDAAGGKYRLTPSAPVVLGPVGSPDATCVIDFTVDVLKAPSKDADPGAAGLQTDQIAAVRGVAADGNRGGSFGSNEVAIDPGSSPVSPPAGAPAPPPSDPPAATPAPPAGGPIPATTTGVATTAPVGRAVATRPRTLPTHRRHRHPARAARHAKVRHRHPAARHAKVRHHQGVAHAKSVVRG
jgi:hypothetical protein